MVLSLAEFDARLNALPITGTRLAFVSDIHIPYHDPHAIDMTCQILSDFDPHVVTFGSDVFDFPTLGKFDADPDDMVYDFLEDVRSDYEQVTSALVDASPNAIRPFIVGNHDIRPHVWAKKKAPMVAKTVDAAFIRMIEDNGGTWVEVDNSGWRFNRFGFWGPVPLLVVMHGRYATKYATAKYMDEYAANLIAGHVHRFQEHTKSYEFHGNLTARTSGCLCKLEPHYYRDTARDYPQNWQQGITLITLDKYAKHAHFEPIVYQNKRAIWREKVYNS